MKLKFGYYVASSLCLLFSSSLGASIDVSEPTSKLPASYKATALEMSINPTEEEKIIKHIQEAAEKNSNPVVFAIQKNDLELAELLLTLRRIELSFGIATFDFPGYQFNRPYGDSGEEAVIWMKRAQVNLLNSFGEERCFTEAKVDTGILKLLVKYDEKNLWKSEIRKILTHAYHRCDLEGILFCLQLPIEDLKIAFYEINTTPSYLVDPFLSEFPINLEDPTHFYIKTQSPTVLPCIWDFRSDDNAMVKEIKRQIQHIAQNIISFEDSAETIKALKKEMEVIKNQFQKEFSEIKDRLIAVDELKTEMISIRKEIETIKNEHHQTSEAIQNEINELRELVLSNKEIVQVLVKYGNNSESITSLHYAIKMGDDKTVKLLIANGANVNSKDGSCTALIRAASCNQLEIAKILLNNGADVNLEGHLTLNASQMRTALSYAAEFGNAALVRLLIENGANLDTPKNNHKNPLHIAAISGNFDAVVALVNGGAKIDANISKGSVGHWTEGTPLDWAACNLKYVDNPQNLELIKFLVQKGATRHFSNNGNGCPVIVGYLKSVGR